MYYLGLDIGGTKCAVSLGKCAEENIEIISRKELPTQYRAEPTFDELAPEIERVIANYPVKRIGISCGGPLDCANGIILSPPNLPGWHGFKITEYIEKRFGISAKIQNDANACALAEWKYGAGKGTRNMIFLTFGTGLGAGLILDGKLYAGTNGNAGEAGHIRIAPIGPMGYGKRGSFEGYCSGGGIARLAEEMAARCKSTPLCIQKMNGQITAKKLAEAAMNGDKFALKVFKKSGEMLGKGLSILIDLFNPERIVIGGVYMRSSQLFIPSMRKIIESEALNDCAAVCSIVPAFLSENIGDYAAISVAAQQT